MSNETIKQAFKIGVGFQKNPVDSAMKLADLTLSIGNSSKENYNMCESCVHAQPGGCGYPTDKEYPSTAMRNVGMGCIVYECNKYQKL